MPLTGICNCRLLCNVLCKELCSAHDLHRRAGHESAAVWGAVRGGAHRRVSRHAWAAGFKHLKSCASDKDHCRPPRTKESLKRDRKLDAERRESPGLVGGTGNGTPLAAGLLMLVGMS